MHINDLKNRVNEKRRAIGLSERTDVQFLQDITAMQMKGMLKVENGDVTTVEHYPSLIYNPKGSS